MKSHRNGFAGLLLDRCSDRRTNADWLEQCLHAPDTCFFPLQGVRSFVGGEPLRAVGLSYAEVEDQLAEADAIVFLGCKNDQAYFAVGLAEGSGAIDGAPASRGRFAGLRTVSSLLPAEDAGLLAYATAMVHWHRRSRFCGVCGEATESREGGFVRTCLNAQCGAQFFPRTDPAIIVLVHAGDRCLLGRQSSWNKGLHSVLAGFVEPGEPFETAVIREIREEAGITVDSVQYHSSQPWPFPGSIMIGFSARAVNDEIRLCDKELESARWFTREQLSAALRSGEVTVPTPISIAYRLLEDWFDQEPGRCLVEILESVGAS